MLVVWQQRNVSTKFTGQSDRVQGVFSALTPT
jgi:hypothetical protein